MALTDGTDILLSDLKFRFPVHEAVGLSRLGLGEKISEIELLFWVGEVAKKVAAFGVPVEAFLKINAKAVMA